MQKKRITDGQMPGDLARIAEVAGVEAAVSIAKAFRGSYLYIPGLSDYTRAMRDNTIRDEYASGLSVKRLGIKYELSERAIRAILGRPSSPIDPRIEGILRAMSSAAPLATVETE